MSEASKPQRQAEPQGQGQSQAGALDALRGRLPAAHVDAVNAALREPVARPELAAVLFDAVGQATLALLGPGLLTINVWRADSRQVVRQWSSDPGAYPVGGSKRKGDTAWARQVLERAEVFVGEGDAALAEVFDDIATIRALGLRAVVNVPVRERGRCIGTFNYLSPRSAWLADDVDALRALAQLAAPALAYCHAAAVAPVAPVAPLAAVARPA